jgi:DNA-binding response OmpR family regulator
MEKISIENKACYLHSDTNWVRAVEAFKVTCNILLVEDEPLARRSIAAVLERATYAVHQADNGEAALDLMSRIPFNTVIADFQLGGRINGIDVLKRQHTRHPESSLS